VVVYADTNGGSGMSGSADLAAGVCADDLTAPTVGFDGGTAEAGEGTNPDGSPGVYAVVDGDNDNVDPQGQSDGYIGLSTYETGTKGSCSGGGTGTNSGGCIQVKGVTPEIIVPSPLVCGNTSGNTWDNTVRDGCAVP
jgi:hypothetical protein